MTEVCEHLHAAIAINRADSLKHLFDISRKHIEHLFSPDRVTVALCQSEPNRLAVHALEPDQQLAFPEDFSYSPCQEASLSSLLACLPFSENHLWGQVLLEAQRQCNQITREFADLQFDNPSARDCLSPQTDRCLATTLCDRSGTVLGVLVLERFDAQPYPPEQQHLFHQYGNLMAVALENLRNFHRVHQTAIKDALTGVYNHRHLHEVLEEETTRLDRYGGSLAVVLMDLDGFKQLNDNYGHLAGDHLLRQTAQLIQGELRTSDNIFRYGGDEFVLLLPNTNQARAHEVIKRLRAVLRDHDLVLPESEAQPETFHPIPEDMTASFGLAVAPQHATAPRELLEQADRALYQAKERGRNQTCLAQPMG